jgi:hypothetical protein
MTRALFKLLPGAFLAAGLTITAAATASAQTMRAPHHQLTIFDRVQQDLDHASAAPYLAINTRERIDHARKSIWKFQNKWAAGHYDQGKLDGAISAVHHVVDTASLEYRDRRTLQDDLGHMREFRAEHEYRAFGFR